MAVAAISSTGCSTTAPVPTDTVMATGGPPAREAGCVSLEQVLSADQCRGDWACTDADVLTLACARTDATISP